MPNLLGLHNLYAMFKMFEHSCSLAPNDIYSTNNAISGNLPLFTSSVSGWCGAGRRNPEYRKELEEKELEEKELEEKELEEKELEEKELEETKKTWATLHELLRGFQPCITLGVCDVN
jgi:hypothetical protein